jgi:hypothetical protein
MAMETVVYQFCLHLNVLENTNEFDAQNTAGLLLEKISEKKQITAGRWPCL